MSLESLIDQSMITIPEEHHPEIVIYYRENFEPEMSIQAVAWKLLRGLRMALWDFDDVCTMVIHAQEWLATLPKQRQAELQDEYRQVRFMA